MIGGVPPVRFNPPFHLVYAFDVEASDIGRDVTWMIRVREPDGHEFSLPPNPTTIPEFEPGAPYYWYVYVPVMFLFRLAGNYEFEMLIDGESEPAATVTVALVDLTKTSLPYHPR